MTMTGGGVIPRWMSQRLIYISQSLRRPLPSLSDDQLRHLHAQVFNQLQDSTEHILTDVSEYKRVQQDLILMMRDSLHDNGERIMRAMEDERNRDIQAAFHLELRGQRVQDDELSQLNEDVLHHINEATEKIIESFENLRHDSHTCHMCGDVHDSDV
jgi:hypothetical protein